METQENKPETQIGHTPGPSQADIDMGIILSAIEVSGVKVRQDVIDRVTRRNESQPELLEACKAAYPYMKHVAGWSTHGPATHEYSSDQIRDMLEAAIAKAGGAG